jgi:hypothetical protein
MQAQRLHIAGEQNPAVHIRELGLESLALHQVQGQYSLHLTTQAKDECALLVSVEKNRGQRYVDR